jgi:hypothetical protein
MIATKIEHKCKVFHIYIDTVREAEHESEIDQVVKRPTLRLKLGCKIYIYMHAYSMHSARLSMYWVWNLDNPCIWKDFSDESVCCRIVLGYIGIPSQAQGNVKGEFEHKSTN